ncbi:MAG: MFS transporter [Turneriella sp.]|nr:MFS transporter [Turneriella sp.]
MMAKPNAVLVATPMLAGGFLQFILSEFYQKFTTDTLRLDSAIIGTIFFISRISDAFLDPLCGHFSDKFGRRLFIAIGLVLLLAAVVLSFLPAYWSQGIWGYVFAALGIFLCYGSITLIYIPHYAWLSELQRQDAEKPFFAARAVLENMGTIVGGLSLILLVPRQEQATTIFWLVLIFTLFVALPGFVPLWLYRTKVTAEKSTHSLRQAIAQLIRNRRFLVVALMSFANQFAATSLLGAALFYTEHVLGRRELGVTLSVIFLLSATAAVPLWAHWQNRYRYLLWQSALWLMVIFFPTMLFLAEWINWYPMVFALVVGALAGALLLYVPLEVAHTTADPQREAGIIFAAFTFANKSAMALPPLVIGFALKAAHYQPQVRTPLSVATISALFIIVPMLAFLCSALLLLYYRRLCATTVLIGGSTPSDGRP